MPGFFQDAKYGLRTMAKNPSFTAVAVLTLGLAIGANTAIFSVVNAVLLQPLPYKDPDQLVRIYTQFPSQKHERFWLSRPEYFELRKEAKSYSEVAGWIVGTAALGGIERPVRVPAAYTSAMPYCSAMRCSAASSNPRRPISSKYSRSGPPRFHFRCSM